MQQSALDRTTSRRQPGGLLTTLIRRRQRKIGRPLIRQADTHRDEGNWLEATPIYLQAFEIMPWRTDLLVQAGNCLKEAGDLTAALKLYRRAAEDDKETAEATRQIRAVDELATRLRAGDAGSNEAQRRQDSTLDAAGIPRQRRALIAFDRPITPTTILGRITSSSRGSLPDLGDLDKNRHVAMADRDSITGQQFDGTSTLSVIQIGNFEFDNYGYGQPLMMGVAAVRAKIIAQAAIITVSVHLDDELVAQAPPALVKRYADGGYLYVVNIWIDSDRCRPGSQVLTIRATPQRGAALVYTCAVTVARTPPSFCLHDSDAFVPSPRSTYADLTAEINSRPAVIRNSETGMTSDNIKSILAMRVDQLGDISASLPALRALRDAFPHAHLTVLVPPALSPIIRSSKFADDVEELQLIYNTESEKRYITAEERVRFTRSMTKRRYDLAIDMCPAHETRRILLMTNARYLVGFSPLSFPFLDFGIEITSRDKTNRRSVHSHAATILSLVESLRLATMPKLPPVPRLSDDRALLQRYGLVAGGYVVIHSGARHTINCWSQDRFLALADRIIERFNLPVLFFSDTPIEESLLMQIQHREQITMMGNLPIDEFDAILSGARIMIGNDSGPKHLAAMRGVWTASIHINRLNWREWGQVGRGIIISKKTPCGGCELNDERLCGKGVTCLNSITVDEVADAIMDGITSNEQSERKTPIN